MLLMPSGAETEIPAQGARHGFLLPLIPVLRAAGALAAGLPGGQGQGMCTLKDMPVLQPCVRKTGALGTKGMGPG